MESSHKEGRPNNLFCLNVLFLPDPHGQLLVISPDMRNTVTVLSDFIFVNNLDLLAMHYMFHIYSHNLSYLGKRGFYCSDILCGVYGII